MRKALAALWVVAALTGAAACGGDGTAAPIATPTAQSALSSNEALIARAKSLELNTPYVPPPGDVLEHQTAAFAKIICSAVFITGLEPDFAAEHVGYFTSPYVARSKVGKPVIDRAAKTVHVTMPNGITRTAKYFGSQGCVSLPRGQSAPRFTPVQVASALPAASTQPWPMGDAPDNEPWPAMLSRAAIDRAVEAAFMPAAEMTAAVVVTWKGRIVAERYAPGSRPRRRSRAGRWGRARPRRCSGCSSRMACTR